MPLLVLLVDFDGELARLRATFHRLGIETLLADSAASALQVSQQWRFDAALVGACHARRTDVQLLRDLRAHTRMPMVVLSDSGHERHHLACLHHGATDVVVKPASPRLIAAKLRGLVDLGASDPPAAPATLKLGPLVLQVHDGTALLEGIALELTRHEFELMLLLARRTGEFVSRVTIARTLPGYLRDVSRSADVHVYRIRKKLRERGVDSLRLDSAYGRGYCLRLEASTEMTGDAPAQRAA